MLWPPIQPNSTFTPTLKLIFKTGPLATGMILNGVIYIQGCVPDICPGDCNHEILSPGEYFPGSRVCIGKYHPCPADGVTQNHL